ncbi:MAG TPA: RdgB/HAM1 family non-canonical purine NTP pyrophosphatase [Patescibacteria group bacterium]|nr:RdgB/HAM1 family non-canonical purine NTP pyrophosphatase [Patescibacteria group bacterium]
MTQIVFASHNRGKVKEVAHIIHLDDIHLLTLDDVHLGKFEIDETEITYEGNAWLKAKTIGDKTRHITLADDSGLEVKALGWKPGVHSARYAKGSDSDRVQKLLKEMEGKSDRSARFVSVIVYFDPTKQEKHVFEGAVEGMLLDEARGENGFGYDPIFMPTGYHQSMAELGMDTKNEISHRARALQKFVEWWSSTKNNLN